MYPTSATRKTVRARRAPRVVRARELRELPSHGGDAVPRAPLRELDVRVASGSPSAAPLAIAQRVVVADAGQLVFEPRELDLEARLRRPRARREDAPPARACTTS